MTVAASGNRGGPVDVRPSMRDRRRFPTLLVACLLVVTGCGGDAAGPVAEPEPTTPTPERESLGGGTALCATELRFDGAVYEGAPQGPPDREPELTGRRATAELPGCDDTGGQDPPAEQVTVEEIAGVPMTTAVWSLDGVLVRRGESLPASAEAWYGVPGCSLDAPVELVGQWLGVRTEKPVRFDGDLRAPLRIQLHVEPDLGNPDELERYTLRVHDDGSASPSLDEHMAQEALWASRAALVVTVGCDGDRFVARSFGLRPRR